MRNHLDKKEFQYSAKIWHVNTLWNYRVFSC